MSKKRKREESTPKPSIQFLNYDFVLLCNKYLVSSKEYLEFCNSQYSQQKKQKTAIYLNNLNQDNSLSLPLNSGTANLAIEDLEHQLFSGSNHQENNFPLLSNPNTEQEQILFSGTNIPAAPAQSSVNISSVPNQAQPIMTIYDNDDKCKYHSIENVIDVGLNCFHPKCHYRKLSQKIDKIINNKDKSAYTMMETKNDMYSSLSKYEDTEFVKAILAVKNDQGTYLLDKVISKELTEIAKILYNFGAETDILNIEEIFKAEHCKPSKTVIPEQLASMFGSDEEDEISVNSKQSDHHSSKNYISSKTVPSELLESIFGLEKDKEIDPRQSSEQSPQSNSCNASTPNISETNTNFGGNSMNNSGQSSHHSFESTHPNSGVDIAIFGFSLNNFINEANSPMDC